MKRAISALLVLFLIPASAAEAKELLTRATACGASGCRTVTTAPSLPFELLGPTIETGRATASPDLQSGFYRARLVTTTGRGRELISLRYFPDSSYIRVRASRGDCSACALAPRRWVQLDPSESRAYASLSNGLGTFPTSSLRATTATLARSDSPWLAIGLAGGACLLALITWQVWRRRRAHAAPPLGQRAGRA